jgi:hypothetical protein
VVEVDQIRLALCLLKRFSCTAVSQQPPKSPIERTCHVPCPHIRIWHRITAATLSSAGKILAYVVIAYGLSAAQMNMRATPQHTGHHSDKIRQRRIPLMKDLTAEQAIDELVEGEAIQAELGCQRMTLEWGQRLFTQLVNTWTLLDTYEALAYEDKIAVQMRVLDEATASLWHLHKRLLQANRILKSHRKRLGRLKDPLIF